jgi:hypothetical protein
MTKKIFISSSSKDRKAALTLCASIESRGYACWISSRDVGPGENFQEAIVRAIRNAGLMVLVFSANANNSDEIKKEVALAGQNRLAVLPVRIEDVVPSEAFSYELATRQWIDVFDDWERAIGQLLSQIAVILPPETTDAVLPQRPLPVSRDREPVPERSRVPVWIGAAAVAAILIAAGWWLLAGQAKPHAQHVASYTPAPAKAPPVSPPTPVEQKQATTDPAQLELAYWQSIKDSQDPADFKSYLQQYPHGTFAALARARLAKQTALQTAKAAAPAPQKLAEIPPPAKQASPADTAPAASLPATPAPAPAAAPATIQASAGGKFDGQWMVTIACPRSSDGAMPYTYDFNAEVKSAVLHGERNATAQTGGTLVLDGHIGADGAAELEARGTVGRTGYAVNRLSTGSSFTHPVTAHFDAAQGTGSWVANRVCTFTFKKL